MTLATARLLVGRTIVAVDLGTFDDGRGGGAHDPTFVLDNGARVTFTVEETEAGVYGVAPTYRAPTRAKATRAIDVDCRPCLVKAGTPCRGGRPCQARINFAAKITREANAASRRRSP